MTALRSFFSARISSCSDSNRRTSSSVYSYVLTRLSSSKRVDMLARTLADSEAFRCAASLLQHHHRRAPPSPTPVGVVEGFDEIEGREERSDVLALHADAAAVNEAYLTETFGACFEQVLARHVADFVWAERVEVERIGDRDLDRFVVGVIGHAGILEAARHSHSKSMSAEPWATNAAA